MQNLIHPDGNFELLDNLLIELIHHCEVEMDDGALRRMASYGDALMSALVATYVPGEDEIPSSWQASPEALQMSAEDHFAALDAAMSEFLRQSTARVDQEAQTMLSAYNRRLRMALSLPRDNPN